MKIMLHSCCGPCTTYSLKALREEGHNVLGLFYNPNIHPYMEHRRRIDAFASYCAQVGHDALIDEEYGLRKFLGSIGAEYDNRCAICYEMRLARAASYGVERGCDAFTTTLTISPYQNHGLIAEMGRRVGEEHGIEFKYFDFRPGYRQSIEMSRQMDLYRQPYCGCVFSEEERYSPAMRRKKS